MPLFRTSRVSTARTAAHRLVAPPLAASRLAQPLRRAAAVVLTALGLAAAAPLAAGPARAGGVPGDFDFWVLSLSWSPSYCEGAGAGRGDVQCARPYGFVVHGLWPQYERGFPSSCPGDRRLDDRVVRGMLDLMPSPGLVRHEWDKHGTCSGLTQDRYFGAIRTLVGKIRVPDAYVGPRQPQMVPTADVERAFRDANRTLDPDEIAVICDRRNLQEVRLCIKKDLSGFRACPDVDRRACRLDRVYMPGVRGG